MDISHYIDSLVDLAMGHPFIAGAAALVLIIAVYLRPKLFFGVFILCILVIGVVYFIMGAASSGVSQKKKLLREATIPQQKTNILDSRPAIPSFKAGIFD